MTPIIRSYEHIPGDEARTPSLFIRLRNGFALTIRPAGLRITYAGELSDRALAVKIDALKLPFEVKSGGEWHPGEGQAVGGYTSDIRLTPVEIPFPADVPIPGRLWEYPILGQLTENVSWTRREVQPALIRLIGSIHLALCDTGIYLSREGGTYEESYTFPDLRS